MTSGFWAKRRVFLTGHTGFKGSWLSLWLAQCGAAVTGFALDPEDDQGLYVTANVAKHLEADYRANICDRDRVTSAIAEARPEIVIHMAAQALVKNSYSLPVETYMTNVIGTAHVLDAARQTGTVKAIVNITTDKCYENREWIYPYRETDRLGGHDPYSNSKACAELLTASWRASYPDAPKLASARAGNVVGGGDWAVGRLVPDCIRAFVAGGEVVMRRPDAVRPWQHALEALSGYMMVAQELVENPNGGFDEGWNFGPASSNECTVHDVASSIASNWGEGARLRIDRDSSTLHEAGLLKLDSTKAHTRLGWRSRWDFAETMRRTTDWYRHWHEKGGAGSNPGVMEAYTLSQIADYSAANKPNGGAS